MAWRLGAFDYVDFQFKLSHSSLRELRETKQSKQSRKKKWIASLRSQ
jgi:hypothetical protein